MNSYKEDAIGYWIAKDPSAILDYPMDWTDWLQDAEIITASQWTVPTGLTAANPAYSTKATTVWLSSGIPGEVYTVVNRISTSEGRTDERSFRVKVKNR